MTAQELAAQSLMTTDEAQAMLDALALYGDFTPEQIIELSCSGFDASKLMDLLHHDPSYLTGYLDVMAKQRPTLYDALQELSESLGNLYTAIANKHPILRFLLRIFSH